MRNLLRLAVFSGLLNLTSANTPVFITLDSDAVLEARNLSRGTFNLYSEANGIAMATIRESDLDRLSHMMHEKFGRCGGYIVHENEAQARSVLEDSATFQELSRRLRPDFQMDEPLLARLLERKVEEANIRAVIEELASFKNRYYRSADGIRASEWIHEKWSGLIQDIPGATVEFFTHASFPQKSVIVTIPGSDMADEVLVLGGHLDSTAGWGGSHVHAPGADDNASGIASLTEILRVLAEADFKPRRTVKFMAYAAEEVGLRGSNEIATRYKSEGVKVAGVLQLDMTNYQGSDRDIYLYEDYTSVQQNEFLKGLIDNYLKDLKWDTGKCGYGCSDHASWTRQGYAASFPTEAKFSNHNPHIHTDRDLISQSGGNARHAAKFARLGVLYAVEASR